MRRGAIILAIASVALPFPWAYVSTTAMYDEAEAKGVYVCGLPALAAFLLAAFACVLMSLTAFVLGVVAYRRLPRPRPLRRLVEIGAIALPMIVVGACAATLLWS
jgi:formate/nitrite transporter FocA (FNT family)